VELEDINKEGERDYYTELAGSPQIKFLPSLKEALCSEIFDNLMSLSSCFVYTNFYSPKNPYPES